MIWQCLEPCVWLKKGYLSIGNDIEKDNQTYQRLECLCYEE